MEGVIQSGRTIILGGRLRHRVQIVKPSNVQDSTGGFNMNDNVVVLTTWASVESLSAADRLAASEFATVAMEKVIIRHPRSSVPNGIDATMQVWFDERQLQIVGVTSPDERQDVLILMCTEIDSSKNQMNIPSESSL